MTAHPMIFKSSSAKKVFSRAEAQAFAASETQPMPRQTSG